jgi:hypothetical protein
VDEICFKPFGKMETQAAQTDLYENATTADAIADEAADRAAYLQYLRSEDDMT